MPELQELSQDKRLRNHFNIDKKRRTNHHRQSSPHFHSYYEIYYMQEGSCRIFLKETVYNLEKGHFLIIPPGEYHIVTYEQKGLHDRYTLYFDEQRLDDAVRMYLASIQTAPAVPYHLMVREEQEPELSFLLNRMLEFYRLNNPYGEMMLQYLFPLFLVYLSQNACPVSSPVRKTSLEISLQKAARYIASNYSSPITLDDAAAAAGFTPTYFSRKFKEMVGIGFRDYLTHLRLKESARLLRSTRLSIQEIADACGFSSSNYFGDVFHSVYGMSPREYRKSEEE
ncbi:MAG TPA: hypothetical protein DCZ61_04110 [Lachnospiraceae bacterium]|nr:hypothetical protein [Lachnospiraceae bacterium]